MPSGKATVKYKYACNCTRSTKPPSFLSCKTQGQLARVLISLGRGMWLAAPWPCGICWKRSVVFKNQMKRQATNPGESRDYILHRWHDSGCRSELDPDWTHHVINHSEKKQLRKSCPITCPISVFHWPDPQCLRPPSLTDAASSTLVGGGGSPPFKSLQVCS